MSDSLTSDVASRFRSKPSGHQSAKIKPATLVCFALVTVAGYFSYFHGLDEPRNFFWDENYYIADAQKELNGIFYMQIHPPLGKLLIAAGEFILDKNPSDDQFLDMDHAKRAPSWFSFEGYRFLPVLSAWLTAPLLFVILLLIFKRPVLAALATSPYLFDNGIIVHGRGAMLDAPFIFFCVLTILLFVLTLQQRHTFRAEKTPRRFYVLSLALGISFALVMATKNQGAILLILFVTLAFALLPSWKRIGQLTILSMASFTFIYCAVWQIHFLNGGTVNPRLKNHGYYGASNEAKNLIAAGKQTSLVAFPTLLRDSFQYVFTDNAGIPRLEPCKPSENGSPPHFWPVGARTINYRWDRENHDSVRYLNLVPNPVGWFSALGGVGLAAALCLYWIAMGVRRRFRNDSEEIRPELYTTKILVFVFLTAYLVFMGWMISMDRILFLPTYFLPLIFAYLTLGCVVATFPRFRKIQISILGTLATGVFVAFLIYRPFTYHLPLTDEQVNQRAILDVWALNCASCRRQPITSDPKVCATWHQKERIARARKKMMHRKKMRKHHGYPPVGMRQPKCGP